MEQIAQPNLFEGDHMQTKSSSDLFGLTKFELAQTTPLLLLRRRHCLDPGKHLLDAPAGIDRLRAALASWRMVHLPMAEQPQRAEF
jgi:hypothetical protein